MRRPIRRNDVPMCSYGQCPRYDGKRCIETGDEPDQVCIPAVRELIVIARTPTVQP